MRTTPFLLMATIVFGSLFSSCNQDPDDDDGPFVVADLTFSYSVTGAINQSENWESPENNNTLGGHSNGVIANHADSQNAISISGVGTNYTFAVSAQVSSLTPGNYTVTSASFTDGTTGFADFQSGILSLDEVTVNYTAPGVTYYTAKGSFNVQIEDGLTPPSSIAFEADFEGLNVTSVN